MATIPLWLTGRHVTAVVATPQAVDGAGLFTPGAAGTFTGIADEIQYSSNVRTVEISALTSALKNEMPLEQDDMMVITEILRAGTDMCFGAIIAEVAEYCQFLFTRGGNSIALYGVVTDYEETVPKGKSIARLTIRRVQLVAGTNPALS